MAYPSSIAPAMPGWNGSGSLPLGAGGPAFAGGPNGPAMSATTTGGNYDQQINALYASVGKTPGMIDQQGRDFWTTKLKAGEDVTGAFKQSAGQVYADTLNGQASPYRSQNVQGIKNLIGGNSGANMGMGPSSMPPPAKQAPEGAYGGGGASSMTMTGGGGAAPVSSAGLNSYSQNPYLKQMGMDLQNQFSNTLLRDTLPGVRGGAVQAGGVGGSRQGIAEGLATAGSNTGAASAVTNLYGQDYENQMRRNLQQYQADQQFALGNANIALGYSGQANQYDIGRRGIDLGYTNANNSYNLGLGNLALGNKSADNNYDLGLGNLDLGRTNSAQNYNLGQGNLALGNKNSDQSYGLGMGNLALGNKNSDQQYNLGMGSQGLQNQQQMMNFYTQQRGQDQTGAQLGANLYAQGIQGEWSPIQNANGVYSPYTGYGNTTSNTSSGGGWQGAVGGAISGAAFGRQAGWW